MLLRYWPRGNRGEAGLLALPLPVGSTAGRTTGRRQGRRKLQSEMPTTTWLVSSRTEGLDLIGLDEPEHEILEEPEQDLPMHVRQGASRD